jgi:MGT family glycosyltransferase
MNHSKRFLFVWWEGGGNMPPALHMVHELASRGHQVHVLGDPISERDFRCAGASFAPFQRAPRRVDFKPENDPLRDWEGQSPREKLAILRDRLLFGPALGFAEDTLTQIDTFAPDALAIMDFTFGAMVAAERADVPAAVVAPHILAYPVPGRPPFGPGLLPARNRVERLRDFTIAKMAEHELGKGLPAFNTIRRRFRLDPVKGVFDQVKRMQKIIVLTSPALELPGCPLPDNVRYAGPILADPAWADHSMAQAPERDSQPLVLVSLSTTFQDQAGVLQRVIYGLGQLPVRVIVTVGPAMRGQTFTAPSNVSLVNSMPHSRILPSVDAMVTHAGHGSVVRALAHGVPLICIPMGRDQNDIAARVVYHGVGVRLDVQSPGSQIAERVKQVLVNKKFRTSARRLGELIKRDAQNSSAIWELEDLTRRHEESSSLHPRLNIA